MAVVEWGKIEKTGQGGGGIFLKLSEGKHKVRLVGKAFEYTKHWDPINVSCPGKDGGCPICNRDGDNVARTRYAINILDRDDDNKIKILDAGPQVFTAFRDYWESAKVDPGGKDGPDLIVKVEVPGGDVRRKKYSVIPLQPAPFTEEERAMIKEKELHDLGKIFGHKSVEDINEMLSGKPQGAESSGGGGTEISDKDLEW